MFATPLMTLGVGLLAAGATTGLGFVAVRVVVGGMARKLRGQPQA